MRTNLCHGDSIIYVTQMISRILKTKQIKGWYSTIFFLQDSKTDIALRNEVYLKENKNVVNKMLLTT